MIHVLLILVAVLAGVLFWTLRAHSMVSPPPGIDRNAERLKRRVKWRLQDFIGTPLSQVRDVRLAATILMIQIVRIGSPVTAAEKARILDFMEEPLRIENIPATFDRAWSYTAAYDTFSTMVGELQPLLCAALTQDRRSQLIAMLTQVASAHSTPSERQREAIARLKHRLSDVRPRLKAHRSGDVG